MHINILFTIDKNYVQHLSVVLYSLFENNAKNTFDIYIISENISDEDYEYLIKIAKKYNSNIYRIIIDTSILKTFPVSKEKSSQYSIACYYRLLMSDLLPQSVEKLIYLDSDLLVRYDISDLWDIDVNSCILAAIDDAKYTTDIACKRLNIPTNYGYFNAGVLLVNIKRWRENNITQKLFNYISNNKSKILLQDQDVLNGVLFNERVKLPIKWNVLECFVYIYSSRPSTYSKREIKDAINNPRIIHWAVSYKPWMYRSFNPYKKEYYKYLSMTRWNNYVPDRNIIRYKYGEKVALFSYIGLYRYIMKLIYIKSNVKYIIKKILNK